MTFTKDWIDPSIYHVLVGGKAAGYVKQVSAKEWMSFNEKGEFQGWFINRKGAAGVL